MQNFDGVVLNMVIGKIAIERAFIAKLALQGHDISDQHSLSEHAEELDIYIKGIIMEAVKQLANPAKKDEIKGFIAFMGETTLELAKSMEKK